MYRLGRGHRDALLDWAARAGLISAAELGRVKVAARLAPGGGTRALADTRRLRERLHEVLTSAAPPREQAIQLLWPQLTATLRHVRPRELPLQLTIEVCESDNRVRRYNTRHAPG